MAKKPADGEQSLENQPDSQQHSTADYEKFARPEKPIRNWTRIFTIVIIILLLVAAGAGGYWYFKNHKSKPKPTIAAQAPAAQAQTAAPTKTYTSSNLNLSFTYPADWKIVDNDGVTLTATSPATSLKTTQGQTLNGKIVMKIQNNQPTSLPGFTAGNAVAAQTSARITYVRPTQNQRAATYISLLRYASTTSANGLDAVYVSADNGYSAGQAIPQSDLTQVSPVISLTFLDAASKPVTLSLSYWNASGFSTPLINTLKSLAIN